MPRLRKNMKPLSASSATQRRLACVTLSVQWCYKTLKNFLWCILTHCNVAIKGVDRRETGRYADARLMSNVNLKPYIR